MKKTILTLLIFLATSLPADAGEVFLRKDTVVRGEYVMLSDLFSGIDADKDVKVAPSPAPGRQSHFDSQSLSSIARRYNIGWQSYSGFEKVSVMRSHQTIGADEIIEAIRTSNYFAGKLSGDEVFESRTIQNIAIAEGLDYSLQVADINYEQKNSSFRAEVNIVSGGRVLDATRVVGRILSLVEVPVLRKTLSAGMIISENDLDYVKMRSDAINQKAVTEGSLLIGKETKKTLKPGMVLTENDVKTPVLVTKSKMVSVIYKKRNMTLSYTGKALENGGMGDYIRFQPAGGTGVLQGVVVDTNTILVSANTVGGNMMKEKR